MNQALYVAHEMGLKIHRTRAGTYFCLPRDRASMRRLLDHGARLYPNCDEQYGYLKDPKDPKSREWDVILGEGPDAYDASFGR